jgi:hypothetical protein
VYSVYGRGGLVVIKFDGWRGDGSEGLLFGLWAMGTLGLDTFGVEEDGEV